MIMDPGKRFVFSVVGNPDDPTGNPQPYYRTTQRSKWNDPGALRYSDWKDFVQGAFLKKYGEHGNDKKPLDIGKETVWMKIVIYFKDNKHGDPDNIFKGIADALFVNDKNVFGCMIPGGKDPKGGHVEVSITYLK